MNDNGFLFPLPEDRGNHYDVMLVLNRLIACHNKLKAKVVEKINGLSSFKLFEYKKLDGFYKQNLAIVDIYCDIANKHKDNVDLNNMTFVDFLMDEIQSEVEVLESDRERYKKTSSLLFRKRSKMKRKIYISNLKIKLLRTLIFTPRLINDLKGDGDVTFSI